MRGLMLVGQVLPQSARWSLSTIGGRQFAGLGGSAQGPQGCRQGIGKQGVVRCQLMSASGVAVGGLGARTSARTEFYHGEIVQRHR